MITFRAKCYRLVVRDNRFRRSRDPYASSPIISEIKVAAPVTFPRVILYLVATYVAASRRVFYDLNGELEGRCETFKNSRTRTLRAEWSSRIARVCDT